MELLWSLLLLLFSLACHVGVGEKIAEEITESVLRERRQPRLNSWLKSKLNVQLEICSSQDLG